MSQRSRSRLLVVLGLGGLGSALTPSGGRTLTAAAPRPEAGRGVRHGTSAAYVADQSAPSPEARGATTTRLADGRRLVAGGESAGGAVATAHVIDPRTGMATPLAGVQVPRTAHPAAPLPDRRAPLPRGRGPCGPVLAGGG